MKFILRLSLSVFLVLSLVGLSVAGIQTARIVVKGVSPDIKAQGVYDALSTGLPNVGKGQKVWLEALALYTSGTTVTNSYVDTIISKTWTITGPPGSSITAPVEAGVTTYFIPDTTGAFKIDLSVTTSHGTATTSLYINSSKFVGVGGITGRANFPQCGLCHGDKQASWKATNHATAFQRKIDDPAGHFGKNCLSCHTAGFDASPSAVNLGFDDLQASTGWVFPTTLQAGNYDSMKANYPSLVQLTSIQCENCHGPGGGHYGQTAENQIAASFSADVCGQCHGALSHHTKNFEWNQSAHARALAEGEEIEHMNSRNCARCHSANGFVNETVDGNPQAGPYSDAQPVTCAACHDPHDASHPGQLRSQSIATACDGCHITRTSSRGLHHAHQSPMLTGSDGTPYTGESGVGNWGGWQFPGFIYPNSSHSNIAGRCADCHMATVDETKLSDTSMVPAPYSQWKNKLGGHTFKVMWDNDTPDNDADDLLNPFGCKDCHGVVAKEFVELTQEKTKGLIEELRVLLPRNTTGDTTLPLPPSNATLSQIQKMASYNWYFVDYDGSFGVHNFEYAAALLRSSIEMVKLGVGASSISSVKDVPNDQGKFVQITWNKFPAESYPVQPVISYLVLRQDSVSAVPQNSVKAGTYQEMLTKVKSGSRVVLAGTVWTKVGEYQAIKLPVYSLNVPTLYDSTVANGMRLTMFEVVGYTAGTAVYASAPASGYSVDNLSPSAPAGFAAQYVSNAVQLTWNESADKDFKQFAIYRATVPNFDPHTTAPLTTCVGTSYTDADVNQGVVYYYKMSAIDFSGNESPYSPELNMLVLGVNDHVGIPTEFGIDQNYPNPFNPTTQIAYQLPGVAHVRILVYNTLGVEVATLVDKDQEPGYYSVAWDGRDHSGRAVASGIYLYRIVAGNYTAVKKMIFMK